MSDSRNPPKKDKDLSNFINQLPEEVKGSIAAMSTSADMISALIAANQRVTPVEGKALIRKNKEEFAMRELANEFINIFADSAAATKFKSDPNELNKSSYERLLDILKTDTMREIIGKRLYSASREAYTKIYSSSSPTPDSESIADESLESVNERITKREAAANNAAIEALQAEENILTNNITATFKKIINLNTHENGDILQRMDGFTLSFILNAEETKQNLEAKQSDEKKLEAKPTPLASDNLDAQGYYQFQTAINNFTNNQHTSVFTNQDVINALNDGYISLSNDQENIENIAKWATASDNLWGKLVSSDSIELLKVINPPRNKIFDSAWLFDSLNQLSTLLKDKHIRIAAVIHSTMPKEFKDDKDIFIKLNKNTEGFVFTLAASPLFAKLNKITDDNVFALAASPIGLKMIREGLLSIDEINELKDKASSVFSENFYKAMKEGRISLELIANQEDRIAGMFYADENLETQKIRLSDKSGVALSSYMMDKYQNLIASKILSLEDFFTLARMSNVSRYYNDEELIPSPIQKALVNKILPAELFMQLTAINHVLVQKIFVEFTGSNDVKLEEKDVERLRNIISEVNRTTALATPAINAYLLQYIELIKLVIQYQQLQPYHSDYEIGKLQTILNNVTGLLNKPDDLINNIIKLKVLDQLSSLVPTESRNEIFIDPESPLRKLSEAEAELNQFKSAVTNALKTLTSVNFDQTEVLTELNNNIENQLKFASSLYDEKSTAAYEKGKNIIKETFSHGECEYVYLAASPRDKPISEYLLNDLNLSEKNAFVRIQGYNMLFPVQSFDIKDLPNQSVVLTSIGRSQVNYLIKHGDGTVERGEIQPTRKNESQFGTVIEDIQRKNGQKTYLNGIQFLKTNHPLDATTLLAEKLPVLRQFNLFYVDKIKNKVTPYEVSLADEHNASELSYFPTDTQSETPRVLNRSQLPSQGFWGFQNLLQANDALYAALNTRVGCIMLGSGMFSMSDMQKLRQLEILNNVVSSDGLYAIQQGWIKPEQFLNPVLPEIYHYDTMKSALSEQGIKLFSAGLTLNDIAIISIGWGSADSAMFFSGRANLFSSDPAWLKDLLPKVSSLLQPLEPEFKSIAENMQKTISVFKEFKFEPNTQNHKELSKLISELEKIHETLSSPDNDTLNLMIKLKSIEAVDKILKDAHYHFRYEFDKEPKAVSDKLQSLIRNPIQNEMVSKVNEILGNITPGSSLDEIVPRQSLRL